MENKSNTSKKGTIIKVVIVLIIAIFTVFTIFQMDDVGNILETLKNVHVGFLFGALGLLAIYIILNPLTLHILSKESGQKTKYGDNFMVASIEFFFNGITPFAVGGQPFQVLSYKKLGVPVSKSTGLIMLNYVVYQMSICIMCLLSLIYYKDFANEPGITVLLVTGFAINFLVLAIFLLLGTSKTARNVMIKIVNLIFSIKFLRSKAEKTKEGFTKYCDDAQFVFKEIFSKIWSFIACLFIKVITLCVYFVIPLVILKSLGVDIGVDSWFYVICMTTFSVAMTCFIPTPGAAGGIEFAFMTIFAVIPGVSAVAASGVLLWRFITYYCLMIFSFITYLILGVVARKRGKEINDEEVIEINESNEVIQ